MVVNKVELRQSQADRLLKVGKFFIDKSPIIINRPLNTQRDLQSVENDEDKFYLNISQTAIEFGKYSTITRFFSVPLARVCIDEDCVHENPDDVIIKGSHIHIYKEGYRDRFAYPLEDYSFSSNTEIAHFLPEFLKFCGIEKIGIVNQRTLEDEG